MTIAPMPYRSPWQGTRFLGIFLPDNLDDLPTDREIDVKALDVKSRHLLDLWASGAPLVVSPNEHLKSHRFHSGLAYDTSYLSTFRVSLTRSNIPTLRADIPGVMVGTIALPYKSDVALSLFDSIEGRVAAKPGLENDSPVQARSFIQWKVTVHMSEGGFLETSIFQLVKQPRKE